MAQTKKQATADEVHRACRAMKLAVRKAHAERLQVEMKIRRRHELVQHQVLDVQVYDRLDASDEEEL